MGRILKDSKTYAVLSNSIVFRLVDLLLIPMIAFYPFIDEIGRSLLGDFALIGLWDELYLLVSAAYVFLVVFQKTGATIDFNSCRHSDVPADIGVTISVFNEFNLPAAGI